MSSPLPPYMEIAHSNCLAGWRPSNVSAASAKQCLQAEFQYFRQLSWGSLFSGKVCLLESKIEVSDLFCAGAGTAAIAWSARSPPSLGHQRLLQA